MGGESVNGAPRYGHALFWQVPVVHTVPHAPQFVLLVVVSTHVPEQFV